MRIKFARLFEAFFLFFLISCNSGSSKLLLAGNYKGVVISRDQIEIPFHFIIADSENKQVMQIINASDTILLDEILNKGDSLIVNMPFFNSAFTFKVKNDSIVGYWNKQYADYKVSMPFYAIKNIQDRFSGVPDKTIPFNGSWNCKFITADQKDSSNAIGEFKNENGKIIGTFLSKTGDYRFLEGKITNNKLQLSTFDGSHIYLLIADIDTPSLRLWNGKFYAGYSDVENWSGEFDPKAHLPNADSLTFLNDGAISVPFSFPNLENNLVSLSDERFQNKIVIVQIIGSWCPNSFDETHFLTGLYEKYHNKGLEIVGLCYERNSEEAIAKKNIINFQKRLNIKYPLLISGTNNKALVKKTLPTLKNFLAFPTMIIMDRNKKVRKIHTGFLGPATGVHYQNFQSTFTQYIETLLNEK